MSTRRLAQALGLEHRNIQNPAVPLSSTKVLEYLGGGTASKAGPVVTTQGALSHLMVLACTRVLADAVATLPLMFFRRNDDGSKARAEKYPADVLVHKRPNRRMVPAVWKETGQAHLCTNGNAYTRILWGPDGNPSELWPLMPHETEPRRIVGTLDLLYVTTWLGKRDVRLDPAEVLHVPGLGYDGTVGYSPVGLARQAIGLGLAAEEFAARFYGNGAWLSGFFEHPLVLKDGAMNNLKASIREKSGAPNAWQPMILEEGMKWHQAAMPAEDAMFLNLRKFTNRELCGLYRVPPHMVADLENGASFSSVEHLSLAFVMFSLALWLVKWEEETTLKLGDGEFFAEFILDALLRGDLKSRYDAFRVGRDGGWLSVNDIRRKDNLPPIKGGEEYLVPLNMGVAGQPRPATPPPVPGAPTGAAAPQPSTVPAPAAVLVRALVESAAGRLVAVEADRARRAAKAGPLSSWAPGFYATHREHVEEALAPVAAVLAAVHAGTKVPSGHDLKNLAAAAVRAASAWYGSEGARALAAGEPDAAVTAWTAAAPAALADRVEREVLTALEAHR